MPQGKLPNKQCTNLVLDPEFSSIEINLIRDGAKRWEDTLGVAFTISYVPSHTCSNLSILRSFQIEPLVRQIETETKNGILGHWVGAGDSSYIVIVVDKIASTQKFENVITHELGHSLGFSHDDQMEYPIMRSKL